MTSASMCFDKAPQRRTGTLMYIKLHNLEQVAELSQLDDDIQHAVKTSNVLMSIIEGAVRCAVDPPLHPPLSLPFLVPHPQGING